MFGGPWTQASRRLARLSPVATKTQKLALALAVLQAADAVACGVPVGFIKSDLDRLSCPPPLQRVLPVVKGSAAVGLLVGLKARRLGVLTSGALVGYFACAIGFHLRAGDKPIRALPAAARGAAAAVTLLRVYSPPEA